MIHLVKIAGAVLILAVLITSIGCGSGSAVQPKGPDAPQAPASDPMQGMSKDTKPVKPVK